jgi:hypothetical protein
VSRIHLAIGAALCALLAFAIGALPAAAATSRASAQRAALDALGVHRGSAPTIVFRERRALAPDTRITAAGGARLTVPRTAQAARSRASLLRATGVAVVTAPKVAQVGSEPAWFFYEDDAPYQAYEHRGRVVLVGARSGRVTVSRAIDWPPLLNGRLPQFLRSYAAYREPAARAFTRLWRPRHVPVEQLAAEPRRAGPVTPSERAAAAQLAAEHACTVRVGDTLGNFYDASSFDQSRAHVGALFNRLARLAPDFVSARYRVATATTLQRFIASLVSAHGCRDILLYVAGGGYVNGGEPAVSVGIHGRVDGRVEQQVVTASALRALLASQPGVSFQLLLDAPGAGGFLSALGTSPNLTLFTASALAGQTSYTALPALVTTSGERLPNHFNSDQLLEYSNRTLRGLECFLSDASEVASATQATADGRARSFLSWMVARALSLCDDGSLAALLPHPPQQVLKTFGFTATPPGAGEPPIVPGTPQTPPTSPPTPPDDTPVTPPTDTTPGNPPDDTPPTPPVDTPPVLAAGTGYAFWVAGDPPVAVAPALTVTDADSATLDGATVEIGAGRQPGDTLAFAGQNGISGSFDAASGVLTLTGSASLADYQAALRTVAYTVTDATPLLGTIPIRFTVSDGSESSSAVTRDVTIILNAAPSVGGDQQTTAFTEDGPAVAPGATLTVSDPDGSIPGDPIGDTISRATVSISGNFAGAEDALSFTDADGISGSYDATTGALTLTGDASPSDYQAALRSVTYADASDTPSIATRTLSFSVNDGRADSNTATDDVTVTAANDAAVVTTSGGSATFTEGGAAVTVDDGVTVSDPDSAQLSGATVAITAGGQPGDLLALPTGGAISGSYDGGTRILTLTGDATPADYAAALRTVTFRAPGANPDGSARTIAFRASDATDTSAPATRAVDIALVDDPPVVTASTGATGWDGADVVVDPAVTVSDDDGPDITGATVAITNGYTIGEDALAYTDSGAISGSFSSIDGTLTLTGTAPVADYEAALRTVTYHRATPFTSQAPRTVTFTVTNTQSSAVTGATKQLAFGDPPQITTSGSTVTYTESDPATAIDPSVTVTDADSTDLASATATIAAGFVSGQDVLSADPGSTGIVVAYDPGTGVLSLNGAATVAQYQTVLRSIAYRNSSSDPSMAQRTIELSVSDGVYATTADDDFVTVSPLDTAPTVTTTGPTTAFTEGAGAVTVDSGLVIADPDDTTLSGATVSITTGLAGSEDALLFISQLGINGSYDTATGTLTLSGSASVADYEAALRSIEYDDSSDAPSTATRIVSLKVTDASAGSASAAAIKAVTVTAVDDPPVVAAGATLHYTENDAPTVVDTTLTVDDPDSGTLSGATVTIDAGFASGEDVLSFTPQSGLTGSYNVAAGTLTVTGSASPAAYQAALRSVTYLDSSDDPSAVPRTVTFAVSDGTLSGSDSATVDVTPVDDAPTLAAPVTADAVGNTLLAYGTTVPTGQAGLAVASGNVLDGASDVDSAGSVGLDVADSQASGDRGGTVSWNADGSFRYTPAAGFTGTETLTFALVTQGAPAAVSTGTVNVTVAGRVFYVDNAATGPSDGTSADPFHTLDEAATAATSSGDTVYVFNGDGTSTGLNDGITLRAQQRLLGESQPLTVGGDTLYAGTAGTRPSIGPVILAAGNTVAGLTIGGTTAAVSGTVGASDGTLRDLALRPSSGGAGLVLSSTIGSWTMNDVAVQTTGGAAVQLTSAGTVAFTGIDTIDAAAPGSGLLVTDTATSGTIADVTVADSSNANGVAIVRDSGGLTLNGLSVRSTGTGTGLLIDSSNAIVVNDPSAGTITTSGPAVDLRTDSSNPATPPQVSLNQVSSSNGARGISLDDIGGGTFSATSGTLSGHTSAEVAIAGGSGDVSYGGRIGDGSGDSADITGRTGGAITFSGDIADGSDAGGGIAMSGNSAGFTTFSGGSKAITTSGGNDAVSLAFTGSHSVAFTGGGLVLSGGGAGLTATSSSGRGSVAVSGSDNVVSGAPAISVVGTDIGSGGMTFQRVDANGAPSGIVLTNTGGGRLSVTGDGTPESGGRILNSSGPGVSLTSTNSVSLSGMDILDGLDDGIRANGVAGLTLSGASVTGNGDAAGESGLDATGLTGTVALTGTTVTGSAYRDVDVANASGSMNATVSGGSYGETSASANGDDAIHLQADGGTQRLDVENAAFSNSFGDNVQVTSSATGSATIDATVNGSTMAHAVGAEGGGITINPGGTTHLTGAISNNQIDGARQEAITVDTAGSGIGDQPVSLNVQITGNRVGDPQITDSGASAGNGIGVRSNGAALVTTRIANNTIAQYANFAGIQLVQNDGNAILNATVDGNTISNRGSGGLNGISVLTGGADAGDIGTTCLDIGRTAPNVLTGSGDGTAQGTDISIRQQDGAALHVPGFTGTQTDGPGLASLVRSQNGGTPTVSVASVGLLFNSQSGAACPQ